MRFLLGMCSGAVLLLAFAGHGDVMRPEGVLARGAATVAPWLAARMDSFASPSAETEAQAVALPAAPLPAASEPEPGLRLGSKGVAALWPDDAPLPEAFGDAYAWWANGTGGAVTDPASEPAGADEANMVVPDDSAHPGGFAATSELAQSGPEPPTVLSTARVWIPFHSERSAAGFAQRLSRALEYPFDVRREGPGSYQVVFPYEDAIRRDEVLARVAMLTGTQQ